jgi:hypothetical protein
LVSPCSSIDAAGSMAIEPSSKVIQ